MQLEVAMLTMGLNRIRSEWAVLRYGIAFDRLMRAMKAFTPGDQFDPEQPRDWHGRWTDAGGSLPIELAARGREAECDLQYDRDKLTCNMVKTPLCWSQAMERYQACLEGKPIPLLRF